ncbi:sodium:solute symporter [Putridiphycobacter roseus]|uniref:Sodium:solute symporter n=1 Tax=Putridiphycobacter roseus TaxID=2219161 RepID=A0A2W1NDY0_9FLAO|nr:sodium:solute symporter [Putridiphycobacter roseus]PZE17313.1 sodium:solute symporter [Putridiphycobacter roseus]
MSGGIIFSILIGYFLILILIAYLTGRKADNETFFTGNKNNKWYVVAFGMIGASLSGITFISIPGTFATNGYTYMQMSIGYILGYIIIAFVLLPMYYRLNLVSIYEFLKTRFGYYTHKMGAAFFILSRIIGAALRMYLVVNVLQEFVFESLNIPFEITVAFSILLIWVYTFKAGIKTIVWTDTLQTLVMLIALGLSVYLIMADLNLGIKDVYQQLTQDGNGVFWQTKDVNAKNYWIKGVLGGMFVTLGMTGVDQDMMQKNLTCKSTKDAQKNMVSLGIILFFANILFLTLGGLLFLYLDANPDVLTIWQAHAGGAPDNDLLFATIALEGGLPMVLGVFFLIGLIAAAYSSADSALTSLTTSVSIDFFNIQNKSKAQQEKLRKIIHVFMSVALLVTILIFKYIKSDSVVWELFSAANFTYGPLLGLFLFGVISKRRVNDYYALVLTIAIAAGVFVLMRFEHELFGNYKFGSELLGINALIVYLGLYVGSFIPWKNSKTIES